MWQVRNYHMKEPVAFFYDLSRASQYAGQMNHGKAITRWIVETMEKKHVEIIRSKSTDCSR